MHQFVSVVQQENRCLTHTRSLGRHQPLTPRLCSRSSMYRAARFERAGYRRKSCREYHLHPARFLAGLFAGLLLRWRIVLVFSIVLLSPAQGRNLLTASLLHAFATQVCSADGTIVHQFVGFSRQLGSASFTSFHIQLPRRRALQVALIYMSQTVTPFPLRSPMQRR